MARLGVNKDYLKKRNRGLALQLVATGRCDSRIELSKEMGLTKTAISAIVNELIEKNYLEESAEIGKKKLGRNPVHLKVNAHSPKYIGVFMGRLCIECVICDMAMNIYAHEHIEKEWQSGQDLLATVYDMIDRMLEQEDGIIAIGISGPGPVDLRRGVIVNPGYFHGIHNLAITEPLHARYGLPVFLDHDTQSIALVEQLYGNGQNYQDILMLALDIGVGSGIMLNGRRWQSASGFPPEMGHVSINAKGPRCRCGNRGCVETYTGSEVIEQKAKEIFGRVIPYRELCQMDDPKAVAIMEALVEDLSAAVVSATNVMNFQLILLCMDGLYWPEQYLRQLEDLINERKFANRGTRTIVSKAKFLEKTPVLGAACNAINRTFEGELL